MVLHPRIYAWTTAMMRKGSAPALCIGKNLITLQPIISIELVHIWPVLPCNIPKDTKLAWHARTISISCQPLLVITMLLEVLTHWLLLISGGAATITLLCITSHLFHILHLQSLLLVQLLNVVSEIGWIDCTLGVVSGDHGVALIHQGVVEIGGVLIRILGDGFNHTTPTLRNVI